MLEIVGRRLAFDAGEAMAVRIAEEYKDETILRLKEVARRNSRRRWRRGAKEGVQSLRIEIQGAITTSGWKRPRIETQQ